MGSKMIAAITWSQLELRSLLEDEEAHVHFERVKRHLGLHPFHLTDLNAALREILSATVNSYDTKLQGIILSYKNPKLLSRMGAVLYDTCYIHIDIAVDFYVFRPNVGDTLKGIVNKKSQDHVGILVHKTFNATIPRPNDDENWPGHSIHIGQEVRFTVTCMNFKDRLPYIRGSLDPQDYLRGCRTLDKTFEGTKIVNVKSPKIEFSYGENGDLNESNNDHKSSIDNIDYSQEDSAVEKKISQKKSKKLKVENSDDAIQVKTKKKRKVKVEEPVLENKGDSPERSGSHIEETNNFEEEFPARKLKFKRESIDDLIHKEKKKKSKVKAEEIFSKAEYENHEASQSYVQKGDAEELLPRKVKKLKREKIEKKIGSKNKTKTEVEIEITHSEIDSEAPSVHDSWMIKNESSEVEIVDVERKKRRIKTEILSSEVESDANVKKQNKQIKIKSNDKGSTKKHKVKTEVLCLESESNVNEAKQSGRSGHESIDKKVKKKQDQN